MTNKEKQTDYTDLTNELSDEEKIQGIPTCRVAHAGNPNCTGVCKRREGHVDADHRDQFGHWY